MDHRAGAMRIKCCGVFLAALFAAFVALGTTAASAPAGQDAPVVNSNSDSARLAGARFRQCTTCDPVSVVRADGWQGGGSGFSSFSFIANGVQNLLGTDAFLEFEFNQPGSILIDFGLLGDGDSESLTVWRNGVTIWRETGTAFAALQLDVSVGTELTLIYSERFFGEVLTGIAQLYFLIFEPLPAGLCDACAVSVGSTDGWALTGSGLKYGTYTCGQDGASAVLELGAAVAGQLELDVYVDSEDGVDFLTVHLDGELVYSESGAYKSATLELEVLAGSIVSLTYSKDGSVNLYADTARLTGARFTPCASCDVAVLTVANGWQATGGPFAFQTTTAGQGISSAVLGFQFNEAGRVVLEVYVDSMPDFDYLTVRRNGVEEWRESGSDKRATLELDVSAGTVITLTYFKGHPGGSNSDTAGLSQLTFEPGSAALDSTSKRAL